MSQSREPAFCVHVYRHTNPKILSRHQSVCPPWMLPGWRKNWVSLCQWRTVSCIFRKRKWEKIRPGVTACHVNRHLLPWSFMSKNPWNSLWQDFYFILFLSVWVRMCACCFRLYKMSCINNLELLVHCWQQLLYWKPLHFIYINEVVIHYIKSYRHCVFHD